MKKPRAIKPKIDMTIPLLDFKLDHKDCFGREWEAGSPECSFCAAQSSCSVVFAQANDITYKYPALDDVNMDTIPFEKFVPKLAGVTLDELIATITHITKGLVDPDTITIYTINKLRQYGFKAANDGTISPIGN